MSKPEQGALHDWRPVAFRQVRRVLLASLVVVALASVVWLGWTGRQLREQAHVAAQRAVRAAELRGSIAYYNEWMGMSARLAVVSGEHRWADRFEEAAPKLDAAIKEAADLATVEVRTALASTTGEAHHDLVKMERSAMSQAAAGDIAGARGLLDGPELSYIEDVYQSGIDAFGQDLATLVDARTSDLNRQAWEASAGFLVAVVLLVTTMLWHRGRVRLKGALESAAIAARSDPLTDLPNRRRFHEYLGTVLAAADGSNITLHLLDLDRFKAVNDAHGHAAGDELLRLVAGRLRGHLQGIGLLARLDGDEFAVVDDKGAESAPKREGTVVARRILTALAEPFILRDGTLVQVCASVGVTFSDGQRCAVDGLMQQAEVAVRQAKADGRGCFRCFEPGMIAEVRSRARLEGDLRQAIATDAIMPHYQPLVDLETGALVGVEMLARWPHADRGMVPPVEFIPLAEETGLIGTMTENLLRRACRDASGWPDHVRLACNVSPIQLRDPNLPEAIRSILVETGLPAHRLEIEITESALVGDLELGRTLLGQLHNLGVRLALDDFGTGYSSLRHLQTLPFDKIKIDRSFVAAIGDTESRKIVAAVVGLGHSLGLDTVAEGVETEDVAAELRRLGCGVGQGWLFGRPGPADRIEAMLGRVAPVAVNTAA